jgi:hypothetical protein
MMFLDHETSVGSEEEEVPVSSAEENKVLMRRFLEAQANADPDALEELLAPTSSIIASNLIKSLDERASYGRSQRNLPSSPISAPTSTINWLKVTK